MIAGTIILEDTVIIFQNNDSSEISYTISDKLSGKSIVGYAEQATFLKALAIAVHNDGMPDYQKDYDAAESIQPADRDLRWIP